MCEWGMKAVPTLSCATYAHKDRKHKNKMCEMMTGFSLNVSQGPQNAAQRALIIATRSTTDVNDLLLLLSWKCDPSVFFTTLGDARLLVCLGLNDKNI